MPLANPRLLNFLVFLVCASLLAFGLYLEHAEGLKPCPLCVVQRIEFIGVGLTCLIAALHGPHRLGRRIYAGVTLLFAAAGIASAGRQIWLQGLPADQLPTCLPSLDYMLEALPFQDIIRMVLHGTADCAEVTWTLLGLSIPEWSLLAFAAMALLGLLQLLRRD
ncbi:disulfide bond formation protein B [Pseudomonas sp. MAP12]|uniref:Disulfide bond formation protein B n=1 Tax=Geopseudomonas aromaticivorans TaxID=2849492 RepID=A0ABS6MSP4_9GAMM|nr:disulfide bond formation protein B [Pseudomonas aromaticivorans]MBV2131827.1 disulfide bond formation protein B [Pseudomonas aromaticivorans]